MQNRMIGAYEILEFIGKGEFGTVYKCRRDSRIYAIKIFNIDYVLSEYYRNGENNRITREVYALKSVEHENVIHFFDNGILEENNQQYVYVVMEYLQGDDLESIIEKETLSFTDKIDIFKQIVTGLDAIHKNNIVHRDLKPKNIFLTSDGNVKILDFGLSKLIDFTSITSTGAQIGSPVYMSPEQVRDSENIDYRSDYYALGVILFKMLTKSFPYTHFSSRDELFYKIIHEPPISILQIDPLMPNYIDNLINQLLKKSNYQRPNNKDTILQFLAQGEPKSPITQIKQFEANFYLRLYNEKTVLQSYYKDGFKIENAIFPINHQLLQKNLLKHIKDVGVHYFIDPATMRLAYDTFADVKGLIALPYAPQNFMRLELNNLSTLEQKKQYVKQVIDEQLKHDPASIVAPFHVSNNSNVVSVKNTTSETWFTLDVKLLKESRDYIIANNINKQLIGGFCIKTDILTADTEKEYFLNVLSGLPCDAYWIYVDCIDYNSNAAQVYQYIATLLDLQRSTNKPVIAGRVGTIGLLLLAFGIYAFEGGTARFESFSEDLFEPAAPYNMYVMYYMPQLLRNVPVERKNPAKIISILKTKTGMDLKCNCPYCRDKEADELIANETDTKKHFLYCRQQEITHFRSLSIPQRLDYIENRIATALGYYKSLSSIFRDSDYAFLRTWQNVIPSLRKNYNL